MLRILAIFTILLTNAHALGHLPEDLKEIAYHFAAHVTPVKKQGEYFLKANLINSQDKQGKSLPAMAIAQTLKKYKMTRIKNFSSKDAPNFEKLVPILFPNKNLTPYFCSALKEIESPSANVQDREKCLFVLKKLITPIFDYSLNSTLIKIEGDDWGEYVEVNLLIQSKIKPNQALLLSFDVIHEP